MFLACFVSYSGSVLVPLTWKFPVAVCASVSGLSAADGDGVIALGYDGLAGFRDHAQVARLQLEMDLLRCARGEVHALESAQRTDWSAGSVGKLR